MVFETQSGADTIKALSKQVTRRNILQCFFAAGAMTIVAPQFLNAAAKGYDTKDAVAMGPFVSIDRNGQIEIGAPSPEIGTGLHTSLPMILAEEMDADWQKVTVKQMALFMVSRDDDTPTWQYIKQGGGGSATLSGSIEILKRVGVEIKDRLVRAAAGKWSISPELLTTNNGRVYDNAGARSIGYGELVESAAALGASESVKPFKAREDYNIRGSEHIQKNLDALVRGHAKFGIDAEIPNMVHSVIQRCPYVEGYVVSFDDTEARKVSGIVDILELPRPDPEKPYTYLEAGVAVVATNLWSALKARNLLRIEWRPSGLSDESTVRYQSDFSSNLNGSESMIERVLEGDSLAVIAKSSKTMTAEYTMPLLSHATMEPQNAVAYWKGDSLDMILSTQSPGNTLNAVRRLTGLRVEDIHIRLLRAGGSFGRRLMADAACEAVVLSQKIKRPVKVTWTREDDMTHDYYRPTNRQRVTVGLDESNKITAWNNEFASVTSDYRQTWSRPGGEWRDDIWADHPPRHLVENFRLSHALVKSRIPRGPWRGPMPTRNAFVIESMLNEIAHTTGQDSIAIRRALYSPARPLPYNHWGNHNGEWHTGNMLGVLEAVATMSKWGQVSGVNQGRGIASHFTFGSYCAVVVDVTFENGNLIINHVFAAVDCGEAVNPSGIKAQIEGGIIDGFSTALNLEITLVDGLREQKNFDSYQLMSMAQSPPKIDVVIVNPNDGRLAGVGEVATPPAIPALTEAIFQATGKRIRQLPVRNQLAA
ncbi:xanthine dehydrogenase family protein molybdopterin-binding subunit [Kordiimonas aquimaris]|uniref:xanthine dehydrogenase family protein molybdopterin-binding subunit n=1 Tax=Kordiimonas aquimaris TaxID=707591 RepID=UPI0021D363F9|nr:molybdopterin cofactor-binding domain-containing protein [Kordiimonas aquimaris]